MSDAKAAEAHKDFYELRELLIPFQDKLEPPSGEPIASITPDVPADSAYPAALSRLFKLGLSLDDDDFGDVFGWDFAEEAYDMRNLYHERASSWHWFMDLIDDPVPEQVNQWLAEVGSTHGGDGIFLVLAGQHEGCVAYIGHEYIDDEFFEDVKTDGTADEFFATAEEMGRIDVLEDMPIERFFASALKAAKAAGESEAE